MSVWNYIFDSESNRRPEVEEPPAQKESAETLVEGLQQELSQARERLARLELLIEGLIACLEVKGQVGRQELAVMVQRVDLSDGYEDGRISPARSSQTPRCPGCNRPRNPRRHQCVFCGNSAAPSDQNLPDPREPRYAVCSLCYGKVPETDAHFTMRGLVCETCFATKKSF